MLSFTKVDDETQHLHMIEEELRNILKSIETLLIDREEIIVKAFRNTQFMSLELEHPKEIGKINYVIANNASLLNLMYLKLDDFKVQLAEENIKTLARSPEIEKKIEEITSLIVQTEILAHRATDKFCKAPTQIGQRKITKMPMRPEFPGISMEPAIRFTTTLNPNAQRSNPGTTTTTSTAMDIETKSAEKPTPR